MEFVFALSLIIFILNLFRKDTPPREEVQTPEVYHPAEFQLRDEYDAGLAARITFIF